MFGCWLVVQTFLLGVTDFRDAFFLVTMYLQNSVTTEKHCTVHFCYAYMTAHTRRPVPKPPKNVPAIVLRKHLVSTQICKQGMACTNYPSDTDWVFEGASLGGDVGAAATTWGVGATVLEDAVAR